jgi:hypothetical protein
MSLKWVAIWSADEAQEKAAKGEASSPSGPLFR